MSSVDGRSARHISRRTWLVAAAVVALGAPLGLASTVTSGIVSALDRTVEVPSDNGTTALLVSAVQTDAAINPATAAAR
jgi:putative serine protease PepD